MKFGRLLPTLFVIAFSGVAFSQTSAPQYAFNCTPAVHAASKISLDQGLAKANECVKLFPDDAGVYVARARVHFIADKIDLGIADLSKAVAMKSANEAILDQAYTLRGRIHLAASNYPAAIADFSKVIEAYPGTVEGYSHRGDVYRVQGNTALALADYNKSIENTKGNLEALYLTESNPYTGLARMFLVNDPARSIVELNKVLSVLKSDIEALRLRAFAFDITGQYDLAIKDLTDVIFLEDDAKSYEDRGNLWLKKGDTAKAVADFREALEIDPGIMGAKQQLAKLSPETEEDLIKAATERYWEKKYADAISLSTDAIRKNPKSAKAYILRGDAYRESGNRTAAKADYTKAIEVDPKNSSAYHSRGGLLGADGNHVAALADYDQAIKLAAGDGDKLTFLYYSRAETYKKQGKVDLAVNDLTLAISSAKSGFARTYGVPDAYVARAKLHIQKGDKTAAANDLREALKVNTKHEAATAELAKLEAPAATPAGPQTAQQWAALGRRQGDQNNLDGAIASFSECLKLEPKALACYAFRGALHILKGSLDLARTDFDQAIKIDPKATAIYMIRGTAYARSNRKNEAIADFRTVLTLEPNNAQAKEALSRLGTQP